MRTIVSKIMAGSMLGSALLLSACGGASDDGAVNNSMTEMDATDPMLDGSTNDVTAIDAGTTGADANLGMDANVTGTTGDTGATGTEGDAGANTTLSTDTTVNGM